MKKTIRNLFVLVLVFCLTLSLCGCGKVDALIEQINLIGDVTLQSGDAIQSAEDAYAALNEEQQAKIENYSILQDARTVYNRIRSVANLIDAIGVVTLESENAIDAAENAYNALSKAEQAKIDNINTLSAAREALEDAKFEAFKDTLVGQWVPDFDPDRPLTLTRYSAEMQSDWDGEWAYEIFGVLATGKWRLDRETNTIVMLDWEDEFECKLIEEDGFFKLITSPKWIHADPTCYVRASDYEAAFAEKFLAIELTGENYTDYISDPTFAGYILNEDGTPDENTPVYVITSKLYEQGYVYIGTSDDFVIDVIYEDVYYGVVREESNPVRWHLFEPMRGFILDEGWTTIPTRFGDKTTGTVYFIKAEYVAENFCVPSNNYGTYIRTTNGAVYLTGSFGVYGCTYEDYLR